MSDRPADVSRDWSRVRGVPAAERRVVLMLGDGQDDDGLAAMAALRALADAGYTVRDIPASGEDLVARLRRGLASETFARSDYAVFFATLPRAVQDQVQARWGAPERDPSFRESALDCGSFVIPVMRCGNVAVAIERARADPVPPHSLLALQAWIADGLRAHALVHIGPRDALASPARLLAAIESGDGAEGPAP